LRPHSSPARRPWPPDLGRPTAFFPLSFVRRAGGRTVNNYIRALSFFYPFLGTSFSCVEPNVICFFSLSLPGSMLRIEKEFLPPTSLLFSFPFFADSQALPRLESARRFFPPLFRVETQTVTKEKLGFDLYLFLPLISAPRAHPVILPFFFFVHLTERGSWPIFLLLPPPEGCAFPYARRALFFFPSSPAPRETGFDHSLFSVFRRRMVRRAR